MGVVWREIDPALDAFTLAGRTDTPETTRGGAVAAVVQFGMNRLDAMSINYRIQAELERQSHFAQQILPAGYSGGLIAVAEYDRIRVGSMTSSAFTSCSVQPHRFSQPRDGIDWYQGQRRRLGSIGPHRPTRESTEFRYFWGTHG